MVTSQMVTSQMCNFPNGSFPKARLGLLRSRMLQWVPSAAASTVSELSAGAIGRLRKLLLGNFHICEVATLKDTFRKLPLGEISNSLLLKIVNRIRMGKMGEARGGARENRDNILLTKLKLT